MKTGKFKKFYNTIFENLSFITTKLSSSKKSLLFNQFRTQLIEFKQNLVFPNRKIVLTWLKNNKLLSLFAAFVIFILILIILPAAKPTENQYSTILEDEAGNLLAAYISPDGQWRFAPGNEIDEKYFNALIAFEDRRFNFHLGIDPLAIARAIISNVKTGSIKSGASTITMQAVRMLRHGKPRTFKEKLIESVLAFQIELKYSKREILELYAANAPYGGNVVGIEAASWRWFGRSAKELSIAEAALLAVLPNSPALIHPGKNRDKLLKKRNRLLAKMLELKLITESEYELAADENLPEKPKKFPQLASHLLDEFIIKKENLHKRIVTTLNLKYQKLANETLSRNSKMLAENGINNAAVLIADINSGNILAYVGNTPDEANKNNNKVNMITANRSTGSILKPLLYAVGLQNGTWLPESIVPDIPTKMGGFSPENYNLGYDGAVPANRALARSLNIPAVRMLSDYGLHRFHRELQLLEIGGVSQPAEHYGLTLILGGCEGSLFDIASVYASMARTVNLYGVKLGESELNNQNYFFKLNYLAGKKPQQSKKAPVMSAAACAFTLDALVEVERPETEVAWSYFTSDEKIAWKTGTSFGFRDGWAIGVTPKFVVAVWAGNANGEGRPNLTGLKAAAPILFDVFNFLPNAEKWFAKPIDQLTTANLCAESGFLASVYCNHTIKKEIPEAGLNSRSCPYHRVIHLNKAETHRVSDQCTKTYEMVTKSWFILPPAMEWYYKSKNAGYKELPPFAKGCEPDDDQIPEMEIIYPYRMSNIFIPKELSGEKGKVVFEVAHRKPETTIFWYIDQDYLGSTQKFHRLMCTPSVGNHVLTLTDRNGNRLERKFRVSY